MTIALCTVLCKLIGSFLHPINLVMIYFLGVVWCAARYGRGPSVLASLASVGAFDFFLVPPYFSLSVDESEYWVTFAVMLNTAILISTLTARVTQQSELANQLAQQAEFERLKNSLLSSVSHDVRTPLATITGAASSLMCSQALQQLPHEHELSVAIYEEAE